MPSPMSSAAVPLVTDGVRPAGQPESRRIVPVRDGVHSHERRWTAKRASPASAAILQERARIARDLHDSVSQTLYAISLTASRALRLLKQNDSVDVQHVIDDVLQLADTGQSELRALLMNIRSDALTSAGLIAQLNSLVVGASPRSGLDIRLSIGNEWPPNLPAATQEALQMICREALHNVVRHSRADRVDIVLEVAAGAMVLLITDNGRGFDPAALRPGHFGMQSMRERAAVVGGTLDIVSADGVGTQVRVCVPREAKRSLGVPRGAKRSVGVPRGAKRSVGIPRAS
jgi:signal transduction histidine kinase